MARIVYGVSGEGSGHSSRAREVIGHLRRNGHEVRAVSYGRGYEALKDDFDVFRTEGLHIATEDNRVSPLRTLAHNLRRLPDGIERLRALRHACFKGFQPDCVFTDFEPMTAYLAQHYDLPLVTLDNQHRMRYMRYPRPAHLANAARVTEAVIRAMVPRPDVSLVTTFWRGEVLNERTFLFPPILRREVRERAPSAGEHVLVYFTHAFDAFLEHLRACPQTSFHVYGAGREGRNGNLTFLPPSRDGFLNDLASCRAVVATAGFTLITEALHLGKPYLALPMHGQFEQELNAILLEESGCGRNGREARVGLVADFLAGLDAHQAALARRPPDDHAAALFEHLDALLADDCREARAFHERRRQPSP